MRASELEKINPLPASSIEESVPKPKAGARRVSPWMARICGVSAFVLSLTPAATAWADQYGPTDQDAAVSTESYDGQPQVDLTADYIQSSIDNTQLPDVPTPTEYVKYPLEKTVPGQTTEDEVKQLPNILVSENMPDGKNRYLLNSGIATLFDEIQTKDGVAVFERTVIMQKNEAEGFNQISQLTTAYGQPDAVKDGSLLWGPFTKHYVNTKEGIDFIGNPSTGEVYEIRRFQQGTSLDEYLALYGQDIQKNLPAPEVPASISSTGYSVEGQRQNDQRITNRQPLSPEDLAVRSRLTNALKGGSGYIITTNLYKMEYVKAAGAIMVQILSTNADQAKQAAETWLRQQGLSQGGICNMPVTFGLSSAVQHNFISTGREFNPTPNGC